MKANDKSGHVVLLRIKDTHALLPVYIGEAECGALVSEIHRKPRVGRCCLPPESAARLLQLSRRPQCPALHPACLPGPSAAAAHALIAPPPLPRSQGP